MTDLPKMVEKRNLTIIGSVWFSSMIGRTEIVGIVLMNDGFEDKAYIGFGEGKIQRADEETIAKYGAPFPLEMTKRLIMAKTNWRKPK